VEAVDWSEDHVRVDTVKGTLRGRCVLTTVSTGILAARHIRFKPGLPGWKVDAINSLPTGTENKVGVHFDKDIFGPDGRGAYYSWTDGDEGAEFEASVMGLNVAIVFTSGRHAVWLEEQGQQAGHDFAVNKIADVFGNDIRKSVTRSIVSAWTRDPWTLGSYSHALPGQSHQREELARSIDDKIFFAGEATMKTLWGNAHGAHESGICAAQEISNTLKRSNSRISSMGN
jgi:monoamine oxidase